MTNLNRRGLLLGGLATALFATNAQAQNTASATGDTRPFLFKTNFVG